MAVGPVTIVVHAVAWIPDVSASQQAALGGDMKLRVFAHLGMSSGFLPAPKLGPFFLLSLGSTAIIRLL